MSGVKIIGLEGLLKKIGRMSNAAHMFDPSFAKVARQSTRNLITGTNKMTGNTARGWSTPQKLGLSHYLVKNQPKNKNDVAVAEILDTGRKAIFAKPGKLLYVPFSNKARSKAKGAKIPKNLKWGNDFVLTKKVKAFAGTKYKTKEVDDAGRRLGNEMAMAIKGNFNGR